jgi:monoamine oxidase
MVKRKTVAVIGGGVSGLAAAKAFDERGHRVLGFERSHDFGGVWELSRSYPDVQTQSPKDLYCYTDHPMPADYPEWPKGPQVHAYLHSYADGVDAADALAVEKASQQIMSVVNAFAGAAEGSGATEAEAFEAALNSVVEVVKTKATNLSDANASAADKGRDLIKASDLALVKAGVAARNFELRL